MKVYDAVGQEKTLDWLTKYYGQAIATLAPADEDAYRVVRIDENKTGQTSVKVRVLDEHGSPSDVAVSFAWAGAPKQKPGCRTQPTDNFIVQYTDGGYTSFAYGKDVYFLPPDHGYHRLWICRPGVPGVSGTSSDIVYGGMLAGTNHHHLDFVFQLVKGDTTTDPEPPPVSDPDDSEIVLELKDISATLARLASHLGA